MISIERCRREMPETTKNLTDEQVAALCSSYELLADLSLEAFFREQTSGSPHSHE